MLPLQLQICFFSSNGQIIKTNIQIFKITIRYAEGHVGRCQQLKCTSNEIFDIFIAALEGALKIKCHCLPFLNTCI